MFFFENKIFLAHLILLFLLSSFNGKFVVGFAYAPNFITKIIEADTGSKQVGAPQVEESNGQEQTGEAFSVKTRFPPEPNGYLHLGHAKAVCFNFAVARMFGGACHMRLDDTNPSKEGQEYVDSILEDVRWIQSGLYDATTYDAPWSGPVRQTSDSFDLIYDCAVELIRQGDAYVDSLSAEEMKEYRGTLTEPGKDSPYRSRSVEENLELFQKMKAGEFSEGEHILRAKIDMSSPNINMRDPALFRIKYESHQNTGDAWCLYPMYDFSHPIQDSVEGISHSLCTLEFEDHRPFYDWTIEKLLPTGLLSSRPKQIEFSRLNVKNTVLSKRKLIQLVEQGHVSGWDDPRMPTLSGLRRRGIPPAALRLFCERMGISKADSNVDYKVLEECVREIMDDTCPRAFCILNPLKVTIENWGGSALEDFDVPRHPKIKEMGDRSIPFGKRLYIERSDFYDTEGPEGKATGKKPPKGFKRLVEGGQVRLRYAYVISCNEVVRDPETNEPTELICTLYPETRAGVTPEGMARVKGIIQWVESSTAIKCKVNQYDRLFLTEEPGKESGDFVKDINPDSLTVIERAIVEPSVAMDSLGLLAEIRKQQEGNNGEPKLYHSEASYQFERSGYFALDPASTGIDGLIFNRVVTLRDTWASDSSTSQAGRTRGEGKKQQNKPQKKGGGNVPVEDIRRVSLRASTILEVGPHPDADSLIVCKVDCGDVTEDGDPDPRTVVAGLAGKVDTDNLVGRKVVCATNLKPAKMRGIESTAMLLAATDGGEGDDEKVELLNVPDAASNGELLCFKGKDPNEPDAMMKSKGAVKAWERAKAGLKANEDGTAIYEQDGKTFEMMTSAGPVSTSSLTNADIQ